MSEKEPKTQRSRWLYRLILLILLIISVVVAGSLLWKVPLTTLYATSTLSESTLPKHPLQWPTASEAAIGAIGYGVVDTHGTQTPRPTASVAKLIAALTVLQKYPLSLGQQGPTITLGDADMASYQQYLDEDGSVVQVVSGEQISEFQALEAMLLPSANNMADSLARWAYGSLGAYTTAANQYVHVLGLSHSVIADDASGFSPNTVSTASDLITVGTAALQNPVIASIVAESIANIPVAGDISNVNSLINEDGINGIKTGNTSQAGGVYLFSAKHAIDTKNAITIIGVIMGAPTLRDALNSTVPFLDSVQNNFQIYTIVQAGQVVGNYTVPWWHAHNLPIIAGSSIQVPVWVGNLPLPRVTFGGIQAPLLVHSHVGNLSVVSNGNTTTVPLVLQQTLSRPSWQWRLLRHST